MWIEGSFRTFDYFRTQYLFSATTILAVSSLIDDPTQTKKQDFILGSQLLDDLKNYGSYPASEFCRHTQAMLEAIDSFELARERRNNQQGGNEEAVISDDQRASPQHTAQCLTAGLAFPETLFDAVFEPDVTDMMSMDDLLDVNLQGLQWPLHEVLQDAGESHDSADVVASL